MSLAQILLMAVCAFLISAVLKLRKRNLEIFERLKALEERIPQEVCDTEIVNESIQ